MNIIFDFVDGAAERVAAVHSLRVRFSILEASSNCTPCGGGGGVSFQKYSHSQGNPRVCSVNQTEMPIYGWMAAPPSLH